MLRLRRLRLRRLCLASPKGMGPKSPAGTWILYGNVRQSGSAGSMITALAQKCQSRVNDHSPCTKMPKQSRLATALHGAVAMDVRARGRRIGTTAGVKCLGTFRTLCPNLRWIFLPLIASPDAPSRPEIEEVKKSTPNFTSRFSWP